MKFWHFLGWEQSGGELTGMQFTEGPEVRAQGSPTVSLEVRLEVIDSVTRQWGEYATSLKRKITNENWLRCGAWRWVISGTKPGWRLVRSRVHYWVQSCWTSSLKCVCPVQVLERGLLFLQKQQNHMDSESVTTAISLALSSLHPPFSCFCTLI